MFNQEAMIDLNPTLQKIEIRFLKYLISLMQNSPVIRRTMPWIYQAYKVHTSKFNLRAVIGSIITGVTIGFLLGLITRFF